MISDDCIKIMPELIIFTSDTCLMKRNTVLLTRNAFLMTSDTA